MVAPTPQRSKGTNVLVVLAIGLAAVLGVFVVLVAAVTMLGRSAATWDPAVAPYVEFVEDARGLEFEQPVDIRWMTVEEAVASGEFAAEDLSWAEPFQIIGLLPDELDADAQGEMLAEHAAAYYDPIEQEIVLPPGDVSLLGASTIVHELTHALQDQHGLLGPDWVDTDNEFAGGIALVEGDAERIEAAWYESLSVADRRRFDRELEAQFAEFGDLDEIESDAPWLEASFYERYALGSPAVQAILWQWGEAELDDQLRRGVPSTELLLDPLAPLDTSRFDADGLPERDLDVDYWGSLGPVTWYQVLAPTIGPDAALDAVLGYGWDEYQRFEQDGEACLDVAFWADTTADRRELIAAFDGVRDTYPGIGPIVEGADELSFQFDVCGPITDPAAQGPLLLEPLVTLAWVNVELIASGRSVDEVRCIAPGVATEFEPSDDPTVDPWIELGALIQRFSARCR